MDGSRLVDPVRLNTIGQGLRNVAREMSVSLRRSAYSIIIREGKDFATGLLDKHGQLIALAEHNPVMNNSLLTSFQECLKWVNINHLEPDDVLVSNDPYAGGQHLPDIMIFSPVFHQGELIAFSGSSAHHVDLGGGAAGPYAGATEIYQEGLRIPPGKINLKRDWNGGMFERILLANSRAPAEVRGDLEAQLVANNVGAHRLGEMADRFGKDDLLFHIDKLMSVSEARVRASIEKLPDGVYDFEDYVDDDGLGTRDIKIRVTMTIKGSDLFFDFSGTSKQVRGYVNSPYASALASVHTAVKNMVYDPTILINEGCNRPIHVSIPYGSVINPKPPAPVRARLCTSGRVLDVVLGAFAKAVPHQAAAAGFNVCTSVSFSKLNPGEGDTHRIIIEVIGGAFGAARGYDGASAVEAAIENCANTPIESLENDIPFLRLLRYEVRPDSGGAGRWQGGHGIRREYEVLEDDIQFATYTDRQARGAWGIEGGMPGAPGHYVLIRDGREIPIPCKCNLTMNKGDRVIVETGGGGGYGDPRDRDREQIRRDLASGYDTRAKVRELYGFEG